jgi:hypothetical protein
MGCQERLGYGRKRTASFGTATAVAFIRIVHISGGTEMRSATAVTGRASLIGSIGAIQRLSTPSTGARNAIRMPSGLSAGWGSHLQLEWRVRCGQLPRWARPSISRSPGAASGRAGRHY